jgi:hypothetical protein
MAARLKDKGRDEIGSFKRRVMRQRSLERISKGDADWLVEHVEEIEKFINKMSELPDRESEFF